MKHRRLAATFVDVPKRLSRGDLSEGQAPELAITEFSRLLRERRLSEDLSIRQAAASARVSFSTLSRVEAGAQPDLATFTTLCAWLGTSPAEFFAPVTRRSQTPLDEAIEHLITDPALSAGAAEQIASVMRSMYQALADQARTQSPEPMAVHLRAGSVMRPGVPERLAALITDMRAALEESGRI